VATTTPAVFLTFRRRQRKSGVLYGLFLSMQAFLIF
jgi:hypothetical protein